MTQKTFGTILIAVGLIASMGWVSAIEPDCYYSTKVGLQIRLCGENYIGREASAYLWVPALSFAVLLGGVVLRVRTQGNTSLQRFIDG